MEENQKHIEQLLLSEDNSNVLLGITLLPLIGFLVDFTELQKNQLISCFELMGEHHKKWNLYSEEYDNELFFTVIYKTYQPTHRKKKKVNKSREYIEFGRLEMQILGVDWANKRAIIKVLDTPYIDGEDLDFIIYKDFPCEL